MGVFVKMSVPALVEMRKKLMTLNATHKKLGVTQDSLTAFWFGFILMKLDLGFAHENTKLFCLDYVPEELYLKMGNNNNNNEISFIS